MKNALIILSFLACTSTMAQTQSTRPMDVYEVERAQCLSSGEGDTGECLKQAQSNYEKNKALRGDEVATCADVDIKSRAACELQNTLLYGPTVIPPTVVIQNPMVTPVYRQ